MKKINLVLLHSNIWTSSVSNIWTFFRFPCVNLAIWPWKHSALLVVFPLIIDSESDSKYE
jgi:hypothetical protein